MPTDEDLDAMAVKIAGVPFAALGPDHRVKIMQLTILADISADTQLIAEHAGVSAANLGSIETYLGGWDEVRDDMASDLHDIGHWFEKSRLFDGVPNVAR